MKIFRHSTLIVITVLSLSAIAYAYLQGDINDDDRIGMEEAIYALQVMSGMKNAPSPYQATVSNVTIPADTAYSGHSFDFEYDIVAADGDMENVIVTFYLVNQAERDQQQSDDDVTNIKFLGADTIDVLSSGDLQTRYVSFLLPDGLTDGDYYVRAYVNEYLNNDAPAATVAYVNPETPIPNLKIQDFELEEYTIILDPYLDAVSGKNIDLTELQADMAGLLDSEDAINIAKGMVSEAEIQGGVNVACEGALPDTPVLLAFQIMLNGTWTNLKWFDNDTHAYTDTVTVSFPGYSEGSTVQGMDIDINVSDTLMTSIITNLASQLTSIELEAVNSFGVRVIVDPFNLISETDETDNAQELSINVYSMPEPTTRTTMALESGDTSQQDRVSEKEWERSSGKENRFKVGVEYAHKFAIYNGNPQTNVFGAYARTSFEVPIYMFGKRFNLLDAYFRAASYTDRPDYTGYKYSLKYLDNTLVQKENWNELVELTKGWTWQREKTLASTTLMIGPVPFDVSVGVSGQAGYEMGFGIKNDGIYARNTMPQFEFDIIARGGPGVKVASFGIVSELGLVSDELETRVDLTFNYDAAQGGMVSGQFDAAIVNYIKTIWGKFGMYVKVLPWDPEYLWIHHTDPYRDMTYTLYTMNQTLFESGTTF